MKLNWTIWNSESRTIPVYWVLPQLFLLLSPGCSSAYSSRVAELTSGVGWFPTACSGSALRFAWEAWQEHCASLGERLVGGGSRDTADLLWNECSSPRAEESTESSCRRQARQGCPVLCCNTASNGDLVSNSRDLGFNHTQPPNSLQDQLGHKLGLCCTGKWYVTSSREPVSYYPLCIKQRCWIMLSTVDVDR